MKSHLTVSALLLAAGALVAADAKDEVKAAATKLADASGYSWKATTDFGGGGARMGGPTEGKAVKDGTICLMMTRGDNPIEMFKKGEKGAVKTQDGWQSIDEATAGGGGGGGQGNPARFMARTLQNYKAPAQEVADMVTKLKDLKKEGDAYVGQMTEEGAKSLMTFGRGGPGGGSGPEISNARGQVKIWLKDGVLSKYEYNLQGTVTWNNNDRDMNRTTTVEIKDVGATKLEVPAAAKAKLS